MKNLFFGLKNDRLCSVQMLCHLEITLNGKPNIVVSDKESICEALDGKL